MTRSLRHYRSSSCLIKSVSPSQFPTMNSWGSPCISPGVYPQHGSIRAAKKADIHGTMIRRVGSMCRDASGFELYRLTGHSMICISVIIRPSCSQRGAVMCARVKLSPCQGQIERPKFTANSSLCSRIHPGHIQNRLFRRCGTSLQLGTNPRSGEETFGMRRKRTSLGG